MNAQPSTAVLVGCGGMANGWVKVLETLTDRAHVAAVVDLDAAAARDLVQRHALSEMQPVTDLRVALQFRQPQILFDVKIPAAHHAVTVAALRHGCHGWGENSIAVRINDGPRRRRERSMKELDCGHPLE